MSEAEDDQGQDEQQTWPPPGDTEALEPDTEPVHPLRATDCQALLSKEIA
jgi:hypothetical protein